MIVDDIVSIRNMCHMHDRADSTFSLLLYMANCLQVQRHCNIAMDVHKPIHQYLQELRQQSIPEEELSFLLHLYFVFTGVLVLATGRGALANNFVFLLFIEDRELTLGFFFTPSDLGVLKARDVLPGVALLWTRSRDFLLHLNCDFLGRCFTIPKFPLGI